MKIGILFLLSILTTTKLSPAELTVQAAASLTDANVFLSADEEKLALGDTDGTGWNLRAGISREAAPLGHDQRRGRTRPTTCEQR